jgi:hypothetical protein
LRALRQSAHLAPRGRSSGLSTDEKTGIQALQRLHPALPMRAGKVECQEHEYIRHATRCLIANFEVATGKIIAPSIGPTRTNKDFASHIEKTIATDPEAGWIFVVDQLNIHQSEALVKLVAKECAIELELDRKGNLKNIKAMASRRTFLQDPTHRIRFVSTPRSTPPGSTRSSCGFPFWCAGYSSEAVSLRWRIWVSASWSSSSTSTGRWLNHSSGPTRVVRSRSKLMGYFHRDALGNVVTLHVG